MKSDFGPNSILPRGNNKAIVVDGKVINVRKMPYNDPFKCTFAQEYKDGVIINGKRYYAKTEYESLTCDGTKEVIFVDGKAYTVKPIPEAHLEAAARDLLGKCLDIKG